MASPSSPSQPAAKRRRTSLTSAADENNYSSRAHALRNLDAHDAKPSTSEPASAQRLVLPKRRNWAEMSVNTPDSLASAVTLEEPSEAPSTSWDAVAKAPVSPIDDSDDVDAASRPLSIMDHRCGSVGLSHHANDASSAGNQIGAHGLPAPSSADNTTVATTVTTAGAATTTTNTPSEEVVVIDADLDDDHDQVVVSEDVSDGTSPVSSGNDASASPQQLATGAIPQAQPAHAVDASSPPVYPAGPEVVWETVASSDHCRAPREGGCQCNHCLDHALASSFEAPQAESEPSREKVLVSIITRDIEELCEANENTDEALIRAARNLEPRLRMFYSSFRQPFDLEFYIQRLVQYTNCSSSAFIVSMIYLDRLAMNVPELRMTYMNCHRLFMIALVLATKYLDDEIYSNAYYARVGGLTTAELNRLEMLMLELLKWDVSVSRSVFAMFEESLLYATAPSDEEGDTNDADIEDEDLDEAAEDDEDAGDDAAESRDDTDDCVVDDDFEGCTVSPEPERAPEPILDDRIRAEVEVARTAYRLAYSRAFGTPAYRPDEGNTL